MKKNSKQAGAEQCQAQEKLCGAVYLIKKVPEDSRRFQKTPEDYRRFKSLKKLKEGLGSSRRLKKVKRVSKGSRRLRSFKNNHEGSRRFNAQYGHVQDKFETF